MPSLALSSPCGAIIVGMQVIGTRRLRRQGEGKPGIVNLAYLQCQFRRLAPWPPLPKCAPFNPAWSNDYETVYHRARNPGYWRHDQPTARAGRDKIQRGARQTARTGAMGPFLRGRQQ